MDPIIGIAGFLVGILVGLTGMGGGALMTPVLVLLFGIQPLAAVSSDLVVSLFMKPVGGLVHLRHGTVHFSLVKWLCLGSVPAAFGGVLLLRALGNGEDVQNVVKVSLGFALLLAVVTMSTRALLDLRRHGRSWRAGTSGTPAERPPLVVRVVPTVLVGIVGGVVVGMTSVGSGSLIIVLLLVLYPRLRAGELVGTDLVQAVPLVGAAALGHALFGEVQIGLTLALLAGAIPGVWIGARLSSRAPQMVVRRALAMVLIASGLKLVGASNGQLLVAVVLVGVAGPLLWMAARRQVGLPASWRTERQIAARHREAVRN
ncbi:MAG TPA: sulfite exporter TauE/SafE family protein [Mycobacteriales bacterium]|nr:sulfite exporter TauE/SafE family protein [Mycobacteriales bacterium]